MDILLSTLNASYQHTAFGLRYLYANLGELRSRAQILEFTVQKDIRDVAEVILERSPKILGLGVYIWNARQSLDLVKLLKRLRPELRIVLGGPEVSYEQSSQEVCDVADLTISGEGDLLFAKICQDFLNQNLWPEQKWIKAELPDLAKATLPYSFYSDQDILYRTLYVEASRGCPFRCEYCLSSLDTKVRPFPIESFLSELSHLLLRGARSFKFIDRTFNLSAPVCNQILDFFLKHADLGLFLHFEMVPDRLPEEVKERIRRFPVGSLQFEIGIQTWNPDVAQRISRRCDYQKTRENLLFLARETRVHTHADLIVGLPGESVKSFGEGFDELMRCEPSEIQVGLLKRLRGVPIVRHDLKWKMIYQEHPPYQIVETASVTFAEMQQMVRFAKHWDLVANSGNFKNFLKLFFARANSCFESFLRLSLFLSERHPQNFGINLIHLVESLWLFGLSSGFAEMPQIHRALLLDYTIEGGRDVPKFLKVDESTALISTQLLSTRKDSQRNKVPQATPKRQRRHTPT